MLIENPTFGDVRPGDMIVFNLCAELVLAVSETLTDSTVYQHFAPVNRITMMRLWVKSKEDMPGIDRALLSSAGSVCIEMHKVDCWYGNASLIRPDE